MIWCLGSLALLSALLSLLVLWVRLPRRRPFPSRPGRLVRGCLAIPLLLTTLGLIGLTLLAAAGR